MLFDGPPGLDKQDSVFSHARVIKTGALEVVYNVLRDDFPEH